MNELEELKAEVRSLATRVGMLEDLAAIRRLHHAYGYFMDYCRFDEVIDLFSADGEAVFLSGVYRGRTGLERLYKKFLQGAYTGGRTGPLYGFLVDHFQMQDVITVAPDRGSAKARFRALLMLGSHESRPDPPPHLPAQVYEAGLYENDYVREGGIWKIRRLEYALQWQALYEKGWAHTRTDLPPALKPYPHDPLGPDELLPIQRGVWPDRTPYEFHYVHPVTGQPLT
jgi:SnoaL-like domain